MKKVILWQRKYTQKKKQEKEKMQDKGNMQKEQGYAANTKYNKKRGKWVAFHSILSAVSKIYKKAINKTSEL